MAGALGLVLAVAVAGSAQAAGSLYVPASWVSVSIGTVAQAQNGLAGRAPGFDRGTGGVGGTLTHTDDYGPGCGIGLPCAVRKLTAKLGTPNADGSPVFLFHVVENVSGSDASGYSEGHVWFGHADPVNYRCKASDGSASNTTGLYTVRTAWPSACSFGVFSFWAIAGTDSGYKWDAWTFTVANPSTQVYTTSLGCRTAYSSTVRTVSAVSAPGGAAVAAFCLGTEYPISVQVVDGANSQVVLQGSIVDFSKWWSYIDQGGASGPIRRADGSCQLGGGGMWWTLLPSDCDAASTPSTAVPVPGGSDDPLTQNIQNVGSNVIKSVNDTKNTIVYNISDTFTCNTGRCGAAESSVQHALWEGLAPYTTDAAPWSDLGADFAAGFNQFNHCDCEGFQLNIPSAGSLGVSIHQTFLNSCSGWLEEMASISRLASRVLIVIGVVGASVRYLMAGLSFVGFLSDATDDGSTGKE